MGWPVRETMKGRGERRERGRRFGGNGVGDAAGARSPPLILGAFFWKQSTHTCTRTSAGKRNRRRIIHVHARRTIVHGLAQAHTGLYDWSTCALRPPEMTIVPLVMNRHRRIWIVLVFFPLTFSPGGSTGAETTPFTLDKLPIKVCSFEINY